MTIFSVLRLFFLALLGTLAWSAQAAITCALVPTTVNLNYTNKQGQTTSGTGAITLNCLRLSTDANSTGYLIGISLGSAGSLPRQAYRYGGSATATADLLNVEIFKNPTNTDWTNSGAGLVSGTLNFNSALNASVSTTYYFAAPKKQTNNTVGTYGDTFTANLQLVSGGAVVASTSFSNTVSIVAECFIGQVASGTNALGAISPSAMTLNYTAFSATAQSTTMNYTVNCTNSTPYSMDLSPSSGVLLGLAYSVKFDNGLGTKTGLSGTGLAQSYPLTATIAAGQAGACTSATCTGTQATTITVTY